MGAGNIANMMNMFTGNGKGGGLDISSLQSNIQNKLDKNKKRQCAKEKNNKKLIQNKPTANLPKYTDDELERIFANGK
jgi:hypothetical protein